MTRDPDDRTTSPSASPVPDEPRTTTLDDLALLLGDALRATSPRGNRCVITGVSDDSRTVRPGDLYAALPGNSFHGISFDADAARRGAVAILSDRPSRYLPTLVVEDPRRWVGPLASRVHRHPSRAMDVHGITGTNGKTSATYLLDAALGTLGVVTGMISGVTVRGPGGARPATRTTPEAAVLQRILAEFRDQDVGAVPMEVSSHAIVQGRVDGVWFRTVAFTNLGPDHLDFHGTMDRYFAAKAALFTPDRAQAAVVNLDDEYARRLAAHAEMPVWTHSTNATQADLYADEISCGSDGTDFSLHTHDGHARVRLSLLGPHQVGNALTALTSLAAVGADVLGAAAGLETLRGVPGRLERIDAGQDFLALVDYMHNTSGQRELLPFLRSLTAGGRLILVIGATGDRDPGKRFPLGHTAATYADLVVVTDESPFSENPQRLRAAVAEGAREAGEAEVVVEPDRRRAFDLAVAFATGGDVLVVAGRGSDLQQTFGSTTKEFDDRRQLRAALQRGADVEPRGAI